MQDVSAICQKALRQIRSVFRHLQETIRSLQKAESCILQVFGASASKCEMYKLCQAGTGEMMFLDVSSPCPLSALLGLQLLELEKSTPSLASWAEPSLELLVGSTCFITIGFIRLLKSPQHSEC